MLRVSSSGQARLDRVSIICTKYIEKLGDTATAVQLSSDVVTEPNPTWEVRHAYKHSDKKGKSYAG
jgi:hypothetical protein